jgi:hypothetical protein
MCHAVLFVVKLLGIDEGHYKVLCSCNVNNIFEASTSTQLLPRSQEAIVIVYLDML